MNIFCGIFCKKNNIKVVWQCIHTLTIETAHMIIENTKQTILKQTAKEIALAKLTDYEKELLGIK
jgi:hypothetical protein